MRPDASLPHSLLSAAESLGAALQRMLAAVQRELSSPDTFWQLAALLAAAIASYLATRVPCSRLRRAAEARGRIDLIFLLYVSLARILWAVAAAILIGAAAAAFEAAGLRNHTLRIAASLLAAWIIVRVLTANMRRGFWSAFITYSAFGIAALYILRWLNPVTETLDSIRFLVGARSISLLQVITSLAMAALALWFGRMIGDLAQSHLKSSPNLPPSVGGLLGQSVKLGAIVIAVFVALNLLGINLGALTFFSGALGVGIGFGLQTVFSNFISGVILLMERSLKIGDFIELQGGLSGVVKEINFRSTLITTNDNIDIIVPNESFIKGQVINWTKSDTKRRIHIPFGVAYGTQKELVRKAGLEAAANVRWTFDDKADRTPQVWLVRFGESRLEFELIVWLIDEAVLKPQIVAADYTWAVHSALEKHGIHIPFPQRDLHVRNPDTLRVRIEPG